ncbi:Nucleolar protein 12 [Saitoella coloradoensis]
MAKSKSGTNDTGAKSKERASLTTVIGGNAAKADNALSALFAQSTATAGPIAAPARSVTIIERPAIPDLAPISDDPMAEFRDPKPEGGKKKRKRKAAEAAKEEVQLEDKYMQKVFADDVRDVSKKQKVEDKKTEENVEEKEEEESEAVEGADEEITKEDASGEEDSDDSDDEEKGDGEDKFVPPVHEAVAKPKGEVEKANRTVFVGNLPVKTISSKPDYKVLKGKFTECGKIESVRFRSVAFSEMLPRKVAFVQGKLHPERDTVNAYIVFKEEKAVREALKLNGQILLDHHIRVDSVAHPAPHDAKRAVFVGNLAFDAQEEMLWKHFAKSGKIEYVRVVRDQKTNIGKGFAIVQFMERDHVDKALLLNDKKTEGKGGRKLRVCRAKNLSRVGNKKAAAQTKPYEQRRAKNASGYVEKKDEKQKSAEGRAQKILGKAAAAQVKKGKAAIVFEGERAKRNDKTNNKKKPRIRSRTTEWKNKKPAAADKSEKKTAGKK